MNPVLLLPPEGAAVEFIRLLYLGYCVEIIKETPVAWHVKVKTHRDWR